MNWNAYFTEDDKAKVTKFLNLVAKHAEWKLNTEEMIEVFKHLQFMQKGIMPKIDNNILEIKQIIENKEKKEADSTEDDSGKAGE